MSAEGSSQREDFQVQVLSVDKNWMLDVCGPNIAHPFVLQLFPKLR